jgi:hypothetical protein
MKAACASPRACVASFPTTVVNGLLYAWLEAGPAAEAEAAAAKPYVMPELEASTMKMWGMTEQPVDYTFWLEQGMVGWWLLCYVICFLTRLEVVLCALQLDRAASGRCTREGMVGLQQRLVQQQQSLTSCLSWKPAR